MSVDRHLAEAIVAHLRQISGDASLTLRKIEEGSVKLVLEGSEDGLERILALLRERGLTEILGIPIQDVQVVASKEQATTTPQMRVLTKKATQTAQVYNINLCWYIFL